jgi:hypothetical protein
MKKIILVLFLLITVFTVGCSREKNTSKETLIIKDNFAYRINYVDFNATIIEIDSCEYIISHVYGGYSITHKGNCKYCKERRDKER